MKILFTMMSMQKGGAERVIANLSNYMINNDKIILVPLLNEKNAYDLNSEIKVRCINKKHEKRTKINKIMNKISIAKLIRLRRVILEERPDVILAFLPEPSFKILFLKHISKRIKEIPVIISVRNDPEIEYKNKIINYIMRKLYPLANGFVFQTQDAEDYFKTILKCKKEVIENPVNENFLKTNYKGEREKKIVAVGRLEPQKNYPLLIEAYKEVCAKHPEYNLEIYGEGSLKEYLLEITKRLKLEEKVIFKGESNQVWADIYKASAFVMSSNYEGMPNALLEAFCLGVPCISTDCPCGGPRSIITNDINGLLTKVGDIKGLTDAINRIIEENIGVKFSNKASKERQKFKTNVICNKWKKFIEDIVDWR